MGVCAPAVPLCAVKHSDRPSSSPNTSSHSTSIASSGTSRFEREIEKFIIRQPPKGEKDDYDSENSWISDGLPSSSRRRRRGDGR